MNKTLIILLLQSLIVFCYGQNDSTINVTIVGNTFKVSPTPVKADFKKELIVRLQGTGCSAFEVRKENTQSYTITKINDSMFSIKNISETQASIDINLLCTNIPIKKVNIKKIIAPGAGTPGAGAPGAGAPGAGAPGAGAPGAGTPGAGAPGAGAPGAGAPGAGAPGAGAPGAGTPGAGAPGAGAPGAGAPGAGAPGAGAPGAGTPGAGAPGAGGTTTGGTFTGSDIDAFNFFADPTSNFPLFNTDNRYSKKDNIAIFYFGPDGNPLGPTPVNVDADDYIYIYVAVPQTESLLYSINVEGSYSATDLNFRPSTNIEEANAHSKNEPKDKWTYITAKFGPFTSDYATITISYNGTSFTKQKIKINTLYNVALGASFISTNLAKPDFDVIPLTSTTNTINKINDGNRTLATFNVIFYWKPTLDWITGKLKGKENITRGRDVLKEANFWERLNPTFGVALNGDWDKNYFVGGTFEFARGGNIIYGWHYGQIQELADKNFELGKTEFTGTKADIKLTNTWKWGTFFGVTLDTRIFNALFKRGQP